MKPFVSYEGLTAPLDRVNVDTDAIIPKQFLKRIERTGFGQYLFFDWRFLDDGRPNPDFVLNQPRYQNAGVLLARANFGCGSSREHAPWAIADFGFRVVIAPSFADIFFNNCFKNGLLPICLGDEAIEQLFQRTFVSPGYRLAINLPSQTVEGPDGVHESFEVDPFRKNCLLEGLDDIGLTLRHEKAIEAFENRKLDASRT